MVVVIFRSLLREDANLEELAALYECLIVSRFVLWSATPVSPRSEDRSDMRSQGSGVFLASGSPKE
jgi:hypothetical protein